jgi:ATP-dependent Lhr-like helicase
MTLDLFHPFVRQWFDARFGQPTQPQRDGWPAIAAGRDTLIAAPTGSGKTLAAFLVCLDRLLRKWVEGMLPDGIEVVYVSPLKALSNDIQRNLVAPLAEISELAKAAGLGEWPLRTAVRTGDTPAAERQSMLRKPPHILVTTPESLYLLLTSAKSRELLRTAKTVIVDEIHALARDKRGSHLSLTLERLDAHCETRPTRIGLSATQKPIDEIGRFLVGVQSPKSSVQSQERTISDLGPWTLDFGPCIIDTGHVRNLDLGLELPPTELAAVCTNEHWGEVYERLTQLIQSHRSTLVFVNTRRMAERIAHRLTEQLGEDAVASHHGSLSREIRLDAEQRLKSGQLKAIVATASLEMGIDIGYIDLVCQIGSPRSIATFLQRVGRSGHAVGALPKGRLFPLTRDELLESLALVRAVRSGKLDRIEIPVAPLDILAQQIVAAVACEEWDETQLYELCRRAWPYRDLARADFDAIVKMLADGVKPGTKAGAYLHRDQINGRLRARRPARLAAITSGGAIPERGEFRVVVEGEGTFVGTVDEDFAVESLAGDIFLLGNTSWRIRQVTAGEVIVADAHGAPPTIPFWLGEAPGRTIELSQELSELRRELEERVQGSGFGVQEGGFKVQGSKFKADGDEAVSPSPPLPLGPANLHEPRTLNPESSFDPIAWLIAATGCGPDAAEQAVRYVAAQKAAVGMVPTLSRILFERFFDESGGMQLVIHAPLGARINKAWGLALRKRFCRSFDFELQAAADDNGVVLSLGPQHSFPIDSLFGMLHPQNGKHLLQQAVLAVPMFGVRWRWNVTRALAVLRTQSGKRVPPFLQKFRSEDLLAAAFPETVGCLENHHGDVEIPDHPLVRQTMHDCLTEAMDVERWLGLLGDIKSGRVELVPIETREPSPFSHQLLNANPYAFLDDAPLEERRTRAVNTRRTLAIDEVKDLAKLDPLAIAQVAEEAWPLVRDADELHDALTNFVVLPEDEGRAWSEWFGQLVRAGRAAVVTVGSACQAEPELPVKAELGRRGPAGPAGRTFWIAAERWPLVQAVYRDARVQPEPELPPSIRRDWEPAAGRVEIVRGHLQCRGPLTAGVLAARLCLPESSVLAALEALEGSGIAMRGTFTDLHASASDLSARQEPRPPNQASDAPEWCERRLLARIHRLTLDGLRRRIEPVAPKVYWEYLTIHHGLVGERREGEPALREAISRLQGFELPAGVWENKVLAPRVADYDPQLLDHLFLSGELVWGRLRPPSRDGEDGSGMAALTRNMPISIVLRDDLAWLLPTERPDVSKIAGSGAQEVLRALRMKGALFFQDLKSLTGVLPSQLEEALRELAALGLVSSDTFAAVRAIDGGAHRTKGLPRRYQSKVKVHRPTSPIGRWSLFPGPVEPPEREAQLDRWCRQLLARYGVLFRDLLAREASAPPWWELVRVLRRMELRGEVRGGRFIAQVGGEQFALESAVAKLRDLREQGSGFRVQGSGVTSHESDWALISAADPLNLTGIITATERIAAMHKNALVIQRGRCVAAKIAGRIEFFTQVDPTEQLLMRKSLQIGRRVWAEPQLAAAGAGESEPHAGRRVRPASPDPTQLASRRRIGFGS